jgi:hypothetical protein
MSVGTLFTLFVVPVFYSLIAAQHQPSRAHEEPEHEPRRTGGTASGEEAGRDGSLARGDGARRSADAGVLRHGGVPHRVAEADAETGGGDGR